MALQSGLVQCCKLQVWNNMDLGIQLKNKGILYCYSVITCKQWWTIAKSMAPQSGLVQHGKLQLMNKKTILNILFYVKYTENYPDN